MKKVILSVILAATSTSGVVFASTSPTPRASETFTKISSLGRSMFMRLESDKALDSCYGRVCKVVSIDQGDGTSTEYKRCSEWTQIPCPIDEEEDPTIPM